MDSEREPHANENKVSKKTLHALMEVLNNCKWVEKEEYDELAPEDRIKTSQILQRLVKEVNVSTVSNSSW